MQQPIGSGFGAASTADDVIKGIDLSGKVAIVTGGYSGIGLETVRTLRLGGARGILPARDHNKAILALEGIDGVEIEAMDLMDPASIDVFAGKFIASGRPLHILVNSAGIMAVRLIRDLRGYESQFSTNPLGHFQLAVRLWPALRQANGARVVSVSSWGHHYSPVVFDDPNFEHRAYDRWSAYGQSKTANILFARALDARGAAHGVRAFALHPGMIVGTGLEKHLTRDELLALDVIDAAGRPVLARGSAGRREATDLAAGRQHSMAGNDQRHGVLGHRLADVARGLRRGAELLRERAVGGRAAPPDLPCRGIDLREEHILVAEVERETGEIHLLAGEIALRRRDRRGHLARRRAGHGLGHPAQHQALGRIGGLGRQLGTRDAPPLPRERAE